LAAELHPADARVLHLQVEADRRLRPGRLADPQSRPPQPRAPLRSRHQPAHQRLLHLAARQPALPRARLLHQHRSRQRHQQHPAASRRHLGCARQRHAGRARRLRPLRHPQPPVVPGNVDGQDARLGGADHRPGRAEPLPRHQRRAERQEPHRLRRPGRRAFALNATGGFGLQLNNRTSLDVDVVHGYAGDQLGSTDRNLPASGTVTAANPRPRPQFSQVGVLVNNGKAWYDAIETQLRTRVKGTDSLQISYTYSKSTLDGVTFYSTYSGTDRTPQNYARNATDTPHNLSIAASTSLPLGFQVSGVFRAISGGPRPVSAGVDLDGDLNVSNDRPAGLPQFIGRDDVESQVAIINAFRTGRGLAAINADLIKIDPVIDLDLRLTKSLQLPNRRRLEFFLESYNLTN